MARRQRIQGARTLSRILWSNIVRQQYLHGMTDIQLSEVLGVTMRTLSNYRNDPSAISIRQLQMVSDKFGLTPEELFQA